MTDTDTSAEAAERLAQSFEGNAPICSQNCGCSGVCRHRTPETCPCAHTAATLRALLARAEKAEAERDVARFAPLGDNHHNALRCPYCNPEQIDPAAERAARQRAEAERDAAKLQAAEAVVALNNRDRERMQAEREARAAEAERDRLRAEVASLRLTLGGKTFGADVPEPIGCPAPGACAQVAEIKRLRDALGDKDEALLHIAQWAEAYPEDIFPPVDVASAREKVGDDALFSRLHAEWARHLCKGIGAIARAALEETGHD